MRKILIFGATSAIAQETARCFAEQGAALFLVARNTDRLNLLAQDLRTRGASQVAHTALDATDFSQHEAMLAQAIKSLYGLNTVIIAHGTLSDQSEATASFEVARRELEINFLSVVSLLTPIANHFEAQGYGSIVVISSVAGDRGRQSNYIYGTAKAGVSTFLQGLRNRLSKANVDVLTVKPGFVATPMTAHLKQGPLFVGPEVIGRGIFKAVENRKDVVYLPWFWFIIMTIIRHIPEPIFKRLSL
jgi:short-subunit dehydrogenase